MSSRSPLTALLALLIACGGASLADREQEARDALTARDVAAGQQLAEAALADAAAASDAAASWRLEQIRVDALAAAGKGADAAKALEALADKYAAQVKPALYRAAADKAKSAGDTSGAIDILAAGDARFPAEHEQFLEAINELNNASLDPEEVEKLKALGYL